ncbi:MAG: hypothetical protein RPU42_00255, partial [Candidatus Sedimenticola sp. (ex Thyasira tokunagai)]
SRDDLTSRSYAIFGFPLALCARRASSIASRLPGTNRLGFQPSLAVSERVSGAYELEQRGVERLRKGGFQVIVELTLFGYCEGNTSQKHARGAIRKASFSFSANKRITLLYETLCLR